ncbi:MULTISPECIES: hypothetical protein [Cyanophyceae]|uniref:hypothetical protein n=1 Tax=Cyanophyceae TaxID=3028117 RepID=UPI0016859E70|nr:MULTISPECIES: hypothetical protein [Cyanophyceae]MBD1918390.1 hypothetical protein [Phormidium sp. FACHB-77]MBD2028741.1 hypothetical protein [Phormidium sp. FACHB-322]MBD2051162.1 hypothetical protein [Leptolyngbya sp. FACHB-60]
MNQSSLSSNSAAESAMATEHDLLASILNPETGYPWQPLAPEAEAYLASLETEFEVLDGGETNAAIAAGWQVLSAQMATQMGDPESQPTVNPVLEQLRQFQSRVPSELLHRLASSATALARSGQPLIEQLVQCVDDILPGWNADDLAVLARPLAYSLRDGRGEILELNLRAIPATDWDSLSSLEQARLTLTVASVALKVAQSEGSEPL